MFEPYQVVEARAWGADCILIIMAAVDDAAAQDDRGCRLCLRHGRAGRSANEDELERALRLKSRLIGINNRDLKTFETTLAISERLAPQSPARPHRRSAKAASSRRPISPASPRVGIATFLVGESLMRQADVAAATRALLARDARASARPRRAE